MKSRLFLTAAALVAFVLTPAAGAAPRGSIACPMQSIAAKDRTELGAAMIKEGDASAAIASAHKLIAEAAKPCAKANKWTAAQTEDAITWAEYGLMAEELKRQSDIGAADIAIVSAYIDEDVKRLENLQRFTPVQQTELLDELRKRGAKLRSNGGDAERQIAVIMLTREMRMLETAYASS